MEGVWLVILVFGVYSGEIRDTGASPRRYKRAEPYRLEYLNTRLELLDLKFRNEVNARLALEEEVKRLKTAVKNATVAGEARISGGLAGSAVMSEEVVQRVADLARTELRTDLDVIQSGLVVEKQKTVQMTEVVQLCKTDLTSFTSRLDGFHDTILDIDRRLGALNKTMTKLGDRMDGADEILTDFDHQMDDVDGNIIQLNNRINDVSGTLITVSNSVTSVNKTVMILKTNCSKPSAPIPTAVQDKCPVQVMRPLSYPMTNRGVLGQEECKHRYKYVYVITLRRISSSSKPDPRGPSAIIVSGIKIGEGETSRSSHVLLQLSRDCNWPTLKSGNLYWIFSDKRPEEQSNVSYLNLQGAVVLEFKEIPGKTSNPTGRIADSILYRLRRGDWNRLCGLQ